MEQINRIEILGTVGNVRIIEVGAIRMARVSVATSRIYKPNNDYGVAKVDTDWHNVVLYGTADGPDCFDDIKPGTALHAEGRLTVRRVEDSDGRCYGIPEIIVTFGNYQITDGDNVRLEPQKA